MVSHDGFGPWLTEYYNGIKSHDITVGFELETCLDLLREQILEGDCYVDTTRSDLCIDFIESCVKLTKSPFYGKPFLLQLWQKAFVEAIYSIKDERGMDRFHRIVLLVGRKNGKSELASALLLFQFMIGGTGLEIVCSSNDDAQANLVFKAADKMRELMDPVNRFTRRAIDGLYMDTGSNRIFRLNATTKNKEGRNIDFAVIDEVHEMVDNTTIEPIIQSTSVKVEPKVLIITTEGFVNEGFLDEELAYDREILKGEIDDRASYRVLPWLYSQDSEDEVWQGMENPNLWKKSNPSLGVVKQEDFLKDQVTLAGQNKAKKAFVFAKDFNVKQSNAAAWVDSDDVRMLAGKYDLEDFRGCQAVAGVDIAATTDLTCAQIGIFKNGRVYKFSRYWIPSIKLERANDETYGAKYLEWRDSGDIVITEGNMTNPADIADYFKSLYDDYDIRIRYTGYDQRFSQSFITAMDNYTFETELIYQSPDVLHNAISVLEADVHTGRIGGFSELDKWCFNNCSLQVNTAGKGLLVKIKGQAGRKIDGAVASAIMYETYLRHRDEMDRYAEDI